MKHSLIKAYALQIANESSVQTGVSKPAYAEYNMLVDSRALIISARALLALPGLFDYFIDITFITNIICVCSFYT